MNSMKDADLPSVAVAAPANRWSSRTTRDLSTIMSDMNHRRSGYPFASTVDFATDRRLPGVLPDAAGDAHAKHPATTRERV